MAESFYTILTSIGKSKLANSTILGNKINLKALQVGDGNGTYHEPSEDQTSLINKVWESDISSISVDEANSNWIVIQTIIPATDGGFYIREAGIFDEEGDLIAVSKVSETYKPVISEGSAKDVSISIVLEVSNVDNITLKIDPNVVVATKNDIEVLGLEIENFNTRLSDMAKSIDNDAVLTQSMNFGMNSKITNDGTTDIQPKFTIQGKTLVNLLGKDGNCEDISKWSASNSTLALDGSNKVLGSNSIKVTSSASGVSYFWKSAGLTNTLQPNSYYCISVYIKNGNCPSAISISPSSGSGWTKGVSTTTLDTTKFVRIMCLVSTSSSVTGDLDVVTAATANGQYFWVDGVMIEEITAAQYALGFSFTPSPYVDSYTCLQNPYIEVRHDNLVRNGNGEEGVAWWNQQGTPSQVIENGYFKFTDDDVNVNEGLYQYIPVKQGNTYSGRAIIKAGTCNAKFTILEVDDFGNQIQATRKDYITSNTTDTEATLTITVSNNISKLGVFVLCDGGTGTAYFKEIILVECKTAPTEYKSCRVERVSLETKLTFDDSITYENGKVTGLINWKHKTLYGKDYDWQFGADYTGYKRVYLSSANWGTNGTKLSCKYDGSILKDSGGVSDATFFSSDSTQYYLQVADSDAGWSETIIPNNDEVKAFMNGWVSVGWTSSRYIGWISVVDNSAPSVAIQTTATTSSSGQAVLNVANASIFSVGDYLIATKNGLRYTHVISAINGNAITCASNLTVAYDSSWIVFKADNPSISTPLLNYCKNNVAPNYEGYQLHYKLANPESITDDNCHIHGDIPKFDVGDNYLFVDSGGVLGEIAIPVLNGGNYQINVTGNPTPNNELKFKTEKLYSIYKNEVYDVSPWIHVGASSVTYGNDKVYVGSAYIDTNATYTVNYKILATQAPQIGSIGCIYSQDISTAINNLQEEINNRQTHDSILDEIVDLSLYEKINTRGYADWSGVNYLDASSVFYVQVKIPFSIIKKVIPSIVINKLLIGYGSSSIDVTSKFNLNSMRVSANNIAISWSTTDTSTMTNIKSQGVRIAYDIIADCRGRI